MTYPGIENDPAAATTNQDLLAVEELRKARAIEYGEWVAITDIPWGTVLAAIPGMAIPASTVQRLKWDELGLVARRTSKAGREVLERTGAATTDEQQKWAAEDKAAADRAKEREAAAAAERAKEKEVAAADASKTTGKSRTAATATTTGSDH